MDLACPNCHARYRIAADAIPPEGREIACAQCGERWRQPRVEAIDMPTDPEPLGAGIPDIAGVDMGAMNMGRAAFGPAAEADPAPSMAEPARGGGLGTIGWLLIVLLLGIAAAVGYGVYSGQLSLR